MGQEDLDFAWAIGLFEGEGTLSCSLPQRRARMVMADPEILIRFMDTVGVGDVRGPYNYKNSRLPVYVWQIQRWSELEPFIQRAWPLLGARRRAQAQKILDNPPKRTTYSRVKKED